MRISKEFALREVAGNYIVVPFGENTVSFKAMITLNETAKADIARFIKKLKSVNIMKS